MYLCAATTGCFSSLIMDFFLSETSVPWQVCLSKTRLYFALFNKYFSASFLWQSCTACMHSRVAVLKLQMQKLWVDFHFGYTTENNARKGRDVTWAFLCTCGDYSLLNRKGACKSSGTFLPSFTWEEEGDILLTRRPIFFLKVFNSRKASETWHGTTKLGLLGFFMRQHWVEPPGLWEDCTSALNL